MTVPEPYEHHPPRWETFLTNREKVNRSHAFTRLAAVFTFKNRYRLASACGGLLLADYAATTREGYHALTKCALFYSAFETFKVATNAHVHEFTRGVDASTCLDDLRTADPQMRFLRFVSSKQTRNADKQVWAQFLSGRNCSPLSLAGGVRHIFLHGDLAPSSNRGEALAAARICDRLVLAMRRAMDCEFVARVRMLEKAK